MSRVEKRGTLKRLFNKILDAVYPPGITCISCNKELSEENSYLSLCDECLTSLPYTNNDGCPICGGRLTGVDKKCNNCSSFKHYYDKIYSVFWYKGLIKKITVSYKDQGATYHGEYMAKHLFYLIKTENIKSDCIAFVPTSKRVKRKRGFDPMERIAKILSSYLDLPYFNVLERKSKTKDQTKKTREERVVQIVGQYTLANAFNKNNIQEKSVILIDDIVTTSATADECSKIIKRAGAKEVIVVAFARA